jgi:hypothetical protein
MPGELIPIVIVPAFFLTVAWVIHVVVEGIRRRQQTRIAAEFHNKLLDRIGSTQEFGEFLNTSGGTKFINSLTVERESSPHVRILRALQSSFVLLALGIGLFMFGWWNPTLSYEGMNTVNLFATIATSLGVGLLLSVAASFLMSKRLGLINGESHRRDVTASRSA